MRKNRQRGEVVVEASLIVTIVVVFISIMFYIGMVLYQQSLVSIMANTTASNIAQVYGNNLKDPFTGYVDSDNVYQAITYTNMKTDAYVDVIKQKANTLAFYRLKSSKMLTTGDTRVEVDFVKKPNELLKSQIIVTVHDKYKLPLVSLFGVEDEIEFSATGRADCVDILEYLNGVQAVGDPENSSVAYLPDSGTSLVRFFNNRKDKKLIATVPVLTGKSIMTSKHYTHSTMPKDLSSDMYDFKGWIFEDCREFFETTEIDGDTSVYGSWECTLRFDPTGGTVNPTSKKVQLWTATNFPTPTRPGYDFKGWFTQTEGRGTRFISNSTVIEDNITLYAHWQCRHEHWITLSTTAGNCKRRAVHHRECTTCHIRRDFEGNFGDHSYGAARCIVPREAIQCTSRTVWEKTCSICGNVKRYNGSQGVHDMNGRCGMTHDLGAETINKMTRHDGWTTGNPNESGWAVVKCTKGECIVCKRCGGLLGNVAGLPDEVDRAADEIIDGDENVKVGWTIRNGRIVSNGMWCREHLCKNGVIQYDANKTIQRLGIPIVPAAAH